MKGSIIAMILFAVAFAVTFLVGGSAGLYVGGFSIIFLLSALFLGIREQGGFGVWLRRKLELNRERDTRRRAEERRLRDIQKENYHAEIGRQRAADRYQMVKEQRRRQDEYNRQVRENAETGLNELLWGKRKRR